MIQTWNVIDQTGRRVGRVRATGYARALVAAREKYHDRAAGVLPHGR